MDKTWDSHVFLFTGPIDTMKEIIDRKEEMRERHVKFIKLLMKKNQFIPLHICARELGVSEKTLRRDMGSLNRELEREGAFIERKAGVGIRLNLDGADRAAFFNNMALREAGGTDRRGIAWDRNSRRMALALNLLLYTDEPASLSDLAYKYYVSRSSITKDLKVLEEFFSRHGLKLMKSKLGTRADGTEQNIRKALTELIVILLDASGQEAGEREAESDMMMTILDCFTEDDLICVEKILRKAEERQNYYFDELEYGRVSVGLLVMIYRIREGFPIPPEEAGEDGKHSGMNWELAGQIADELTKVYGMEISHREQAAVAALLETTHLSDSSADSGQEEDTELLEAFGSDFIDAFSVIMEVNLREESGLYQNIMAHIALMLKRVRANTPARNPLTAQIMGEYRGTLNVCRMICWILSRKFGLPEICMDEICYLTLYIQGEILEKEEKAKVLLVSNQQKGIVNLMRHKLLTRHSKWEITECSYYGFFEKEQETYDFVLSTLFLDPKECRIPYAFVSPMLSAEDWKHIEAMSRDAREFPQRYLQKLAGTVNDLRDIGCEVRAVSRETPFLPDLQSVCIEGQKRIRYLYLFRPEGRNSCRFVADCLSGKIRAVEFEMDNWDFMLFASKLIYLLGSCRDEILDEFYDYLLHGPGEESL